MNLDNPPPGAAQAAEIRPTVLRPHATPRRAGAPWAAPGAPQASWLLLILDIAAVYGNRVMAGQGHIFARIISWNGHPQAAVAAAIVGAAAMAVAAARTGGLRRATPGGLRLWAGAAGAAAVGAAAAVAALIAAVTLLILVVVGALAAAVLAIAVGGVLGLAVGQAMAG